MCVPFITIARASLKNNNLVIGTRIGGIYEAIPQSFANHRRLSVAKCFIDFARHKGAKRRQYAAVLLSLLVPKLTETATLRAIFDHLSAAAQRDRNEIVREYASRATRHIKQGLKVVAPDTEKSNAQ